MKRGAWLRADTGDWHWIDDHADWIRRPACARAAGLPEEAVLRLAAMPRRQASGEERKAILLAAMEQGLIRYREHGTVVTFESILPPEEVFRRVARFMAAEFGPYTMVRCNQLPEGPCVAGTYRELVATDVEGQGATLPP